MIQAVIFDLDGVIVDSERLHIDAWKTLFRDRGVRVTDEQFRNAVGQTDYGFLEEIFAREKIDAEPRDWQLAKREIYVGLLHSEAAEHPGVGDAVRALARGYRLAVASSAWRMCIDIVLQKFDLTDHFDVIVAKEDVTRHKPDPEAYLETARRLSIEPARCAAIEDSLRGVEAVKRAGMRCIAVTNNFTADQLSEADLVVDSLSELDAIESLLGHGGREES